VFIATQSLVFMLFLCASLQHFCAVNRKYYSLLYSSIMKNEPYNNLKRFCLSGFLAMLVCCCSVRAHAQFIPIDSGFAEMLIAQNPNFAPCVNNYMLDTSCAKAANEFVVRLGPPTTALARTAKSFAGLEYFARNYVHVIGKGQNLVIDSNVSLTYLPELPEIYGYLNITRCPSLNFIPDMGDWISNYNCTYSGVTSIAALPGKCMYLNIGFTPLESLPAFPDSIVNMSIANNRLTSLNKIPPSCVYVNAANNKIGSIVNFGMNLQSMYLGNNELSWLPKLNESIATLDLQNNPIACLPALPASLVTLIDSNTNITCLPNKPTNLNSQKPVCTSGCVVKSFGGHIFFDLNGNCIFDSTDLPAKNKVVSIDSSEEYTISDSYGRYFFAGLDSGTYSYKALNISYPSAQTCGDSIIHLTYNGTDTIDNLDIPLTVLEHCANLFVDISAPAIVINRPNKHTVLVWNDGTDTAFNAYVLVQFDPELVLLSASPAWSQLLSGNTARFDIGNMAPGQEFKCIMYDSTSRLAPIGQTACVRAQVFPSGGCTQAHATWDSSHLEVRSTWITGEPDVKFRLLNSGKSMSDSSEYRIYEEELLMVRAKFKLKGMDSLIIIVPANGHTYRMEADQRPGHPGFSKPRDFMELAGTPPFNLGFIVPVPQDDDDEWVEIDCHEIRAAYDPNVKEVFPSGVGANHYITAGDNLDYIIHFQNTGNDTARIVRLVDVLDANHLDVSSFASGVSSHPYSVAMGGDGVVTWTFDSIMLVDSMTNEPASHGFVKFKIRQLAGNAPGTLINNFADIYFDYNAPVRTNTAFVTIEEKENIFPMKITGITEVDNNYSIRLMPNPFMETATFTITTTTAGADGYTFELADVMGRTVLSKKVSDSFMLRRSDISSGMYFFRITQNNHLVGTGKIIAE
jgi:uncharacterized repeat protein (TIGR01451 family)